MNLTDTNMSILTQKAKCDSTDQMNIGEAVEHLNWRS